MYVLSVRARIKLQLLKKNHRMIIVVSLSVCHGAQTGDQQTAERGKVLWSVVLLRCPPLDGDVVYTPE